MPDQTPVETDKTPSEAPETPENPEKPPLSGPEIEKEIAAPIADAVAEIAEIADEIENPKWLTPLMNEIKTLASGLDKLSSKIESIPTPTPTPTPPPPEMTQPSEPAQDDTPTTVPVQNVSKKEEQKKTQEKVNRKFW